MKSSEDSASIQVCNEKNFLVVGFRFFVSDVISEIDFWPFWLMLPGLGPNHWTRDGEPIYYHGPHKMWIITFGLQTTTGCILKFYLYLTMRDGGFLLHPTLSSCVSWGFVVRFDAVQCSKLGNRNSDAGHTKCCCRPHLAPGLQVPHPCTRWKWFAQVFIGN